MREDIKSLETINDMRAILADEIQKIRDGKTSAANVNAIVNASGKILTTIKMEIEYNKLVGTVPEIQFIKAGKRSLAPGKSV